MTQRRKPGTGKGVTEAEFQAYVMDAAEKAGWLVSHARRGMVRGVWLTNTSSPGFPDLVLVRPPQLVFLELKRDRRQKPRPEQLRWIGALQRVESVEAYVASPEDTEEILHMLARPKPDDGQVSLLS